MSEAVALLGGAWLAHAGAGEGLPATGSAALEVSSRRAGRARAETRLASELALAGEYGPAELVDLAQHPGAMHAGLEL